MNNFPIRVCWFELGEGQLGFQAALVYISRIRRSVLRKILKVHMFMGSLHPYLQAGLHSQTVTS